MILASRELYDLTKAMKGEPPAKKKKKTSDHSSTASHNPDAESSATAVGRPRTRAYARPFDVTKCVICQVDKRQPKNRRELEPLSKYV